MFFFFFWKTGKDWRCADWSAKSSLKTSYWPLLYTDLSRGLLLVCLFLKLQGRQFRLKEAVKANLNCIIFISFDQSNNFVITAGKT